MDPQKSTNDRSLPWALRATRTGMRVLSGVAPGVATKAAMNLFCTPRKHRRPAAEEQALAKAEPLHVRLGLERLAAWRWGTGPAVLLAHGWEGRGSQLHAFIEPLVAAGYSAVTWDAPGHGDSPGKQSSLVEFADAIWAVGRQVGEVQGLIGHSFGCAAGAYALAEGLPIERAVFVAPPASLADYSREFAQLVGVSDRVLERMIHSLEQRYHVNVEDLDVDRMDLPTDKPLLLIHDEGDKEVPLACSQRIARGWANSELMTTSGLGHRRILKDPEVVAAAVRWLEV